MIGKTQKFDNVEVNKKTFHTFKQPITLNLVDIDKIVMSDKCKHSDDGFKYFIGYKEDNIIKPLYIILPSISGSIKYFDNGGKNMSLKTEDDDVLVKYNQVWNKIKKMLSIKLHSQPVYDEKYIKTEAKIFNDVVNTIFLDNEIPKERNHYTSIAAICIDSIMKIDKKNYPQVYLEQCKYEIKKKKMVNFIDVELDLDLNDSDDYDSE